MILGSHAKINLGLYITGRRSDGFHELQTVMVPVGFCDIIEIVPLPGTGKGLVFSASGIGVETGPGKNLCELAYHAMADIRDFPRVKVHLHKQIPVGAGLGGGSSNASAMLQGLNYLLDEPLDHKVLHRLAAELGSDCPFFLEDGPMMAEGRGEVLSPVNVSLEDLRVVIVFTGLQISTAGAYSEVVPVRRSTHLGEHVARPAADWQGLLENDFEKTDFLRHPDLGKIKEELYDSGAVYASMSGSGSAMYGLFKDAPALPEKLKKHLVWQGPAGKPGPLI